MAGQTLVSRGCYGVARRILNTILVAECHCEYQLRADILLAAARFGEAQLYGAPDRVMLTTLLELETGVF